MIEDREYDPALPDVMAGADPNATVDLERVRTLLFGDELVELAELRRRLDALGVTAEELADQLPEAIILRSGRDDQLARALAPTLNRAFAESVERNPGQITSAIFPIIGPAIRKSIAETMAGLVQTINRAIEHSFSWNGVRWRFEALRTGVPYGQVVIKHSLIYRVEQAFLIHKETGLLLAHVVADDLDTPDADVISSMLTAITDFVQDSFNAGGGGFSRMSVAQHTINVQQGPAAMLGVVLQGAAPEELNERLMVILERIHLQFGGALAAFDGDSAPFEATEPLLQEALETVVQTDMPGRRRTNSIRAAWTAAAVVVLIWGWMLVQRSREWSRAMAVLDRTPGIVVIDASRGFRTWELFGMWDPAAPHPAQVLVDSVGIDPERILGAWSRYLSFEPEIVMARAAQVLEMPAGSAVVLERVTPTDPTQRETAYTLKGRGVASAQWILNARTAAGRIPGLQSLDLDDVTIAVPDTLTAFGDFVTSRRITFAVGSSEIIGAARATLDSIVAVVTAADREALLHSLTLRLEVLGRTDTTGTNETNQVLSQRRADVVREALIAQGLAEEYIRSTGIGTTSPVAGPDRETEARLNRTVSFAVRFTLREPVGGRPE